MTRFITLELPEVGGPIKVTYEANVNGALLKHSGTAGYADTVATIEGDMLARLKSRVDTAVGTHDAVLKSVAAMER